MVPAYINWSGGKDCCLALYEVMKEGVYQPEYLFTTCSRALQRVSMHGVRKEMITRQAQALGIRSRKVYLPENNPMPVYNQFMQHEMALMQQRGIYHAVFGDIFLEDLKEYREKQLKSVDMKGIFPLWKKPVKEIYSSLVDAGFKAMIICLDDRKLPSSFLGKTLDHNLLSDFPTEVDICGENGEFHTFVYDGPNFKHPVAFHEGERVQRTYPNPEGGELSFSFLDIHPPDFPSNN